MLKRFVTSDSVALTGCVVGLLSVIPGWLSLKPNRLASGASLNLWDGPGRIAGIVIPGLWVLCLLLSIVRKDRKAVILLGLALNLIIIGSFLWSGLAASRLLETEPAFSRVALGAGVWTTCLGAYISIFPCRQTLAGHFWWQSLVSYSGLVAIAVLLFTGLLDHISLVVEFRQQQVQFLHQLGSHIILFSVSVALGIIIGIPLGILAERSQHAERPVFFITGTLQTLPSLALFGLLLAPLSALSYAFPVLRQWGISGIGTAPAMIALVIYSLLPIVRNTYVSLKQLDPAIINAGLGMGMSRSQLFFRIKTPLAAPLVIEGIRTASVQAVGNTAVAALIGAGGLGWFIFQGISQAVGDVVLVGALPIMGLALIVDIVMRRVIKIATPKAIRTA